MTENFFLQVLQTSKNKTLHIKIFFPNIYGFPNILSLFCWQTTDITNKGQ